MIRLLVDADACPVCKIVEKVGREKLLGVIFFCDTNHILTADYAEVKILDAGPDSVDFALVNASRKGDIVVTQDYGVAAMALAKGSYPIHHNGKWYTNKNIDQMLEQRHFARKARNGKGKNHLKGPKKREASADLRFEESLRRLIEEIKKKG